MNAEQARKSVFHTQTRVANLVDLLELSPPDGLADDPALQARRLRSALKSIDSVVADLVAEQQLQARIAEAQ